MSTTPGPTATTRVRLWMTVCVLCAAQVLIILDQNIVNVALPAIRDDLGFSSSNLVWAVNSYVIPFGGFLLLAGRLGDLISRKRVFLVGLTVFVAASVWCGTADNQAMLLTARFVQGVGGAVTSAGLLGMVVAVFSDLADRARAIGAFGFASAGGGAMGTVVGGFVTEVLSWNWIFFINLPIGLTVGVLASRLLPRDSGSGRLSGADAAGSVLVTGGVMVGVYALINVESQGWSAPSTLTGAVLAMGLLGGFTLRQRLAEAPLIPVRVLRTPNVVAANLIQALMVGGLFAFMFFTVLLLQQVWNYTPLEAGVAFVPAPVVIAIVSLAVAPRLLARFGPRAVVLTGLSVVLVGFLLFSRVSVTGEYTTSVLPAMVVLAFGFAITMPALMTLGMSDVPASDSGVASGLFNTAQQVGGAVGLAVLSSTAAAQSRRLIADGTSQVAALVGGYQLGYLLAAGFTLAAVTLAASTVKARPPAPAAAP